MKKLGLALLLLFLSSVGHTAVSQTPEETFHTANQAFNDGHYDQAAEGYLSLLASGIENGSIHGNLGQALFRQGKLGEALFQFLMASKLKPRDPDLEANLNYLRGQVTDQIEPRPLNIAERILKNVSARMNRRENWIGFLGLWFAFWILAAARLFWSKDLLRWSSWILGAALLLMTASLVQKEFLERPVGVVIARQANVYSGPGESNILLFELHEGAEVSVLSHDLSGWFRIELADGKKGWMSGTNLASEGS